MDNYREDVYTLNDIIHSACLFNKTPKLALVYLSSEGIEIYSLNDFHKSICSIETEHRVNLVSVSKNDRYLVASGSLGYNGCVAIYETHGFSLRFKIELWSFDSQLHQLTWDTRHLLVYDDGYIHVYDNTNDQFELNFNVSLDLQSYDAEIHQNSDYNLYSNLSTAYNLSIKEKKLRKLNIGEHDEILGILRRQNLALIHRNNYEVILFNLDTEDIIQRVDWLSLWMHIHVSDDDNLVIIENELPMRDPKIQLSLCKLNCLAEQPVNLFDSFESILIGFTGFNSELIAFNHNEIIAIRMATKKYVIEAKETTVEQLIFSN